MPESQLPAHNLSGLEVKYHCEVVPAALEPQVGEVLYPASGVGHASVAHAVLWSSLVAVVGKPFQGIGCSQYFGWCTAAVTSFLGRPDNANAGQRTNASCFVLAPAQVQTQPSHAVQRMLFVSFA